MPFTENNISLTLDLAVSFVEQHCERNAIKFYRRKPAVAETDAQVIIIGTDAGNYGSIGWCPNRTSELGVFAGMAQNITGQN